MSSESMISLSNNFEGKLQEKFYARNYFINLNGLMTNMMGVNTLNERQKLANGYLTSLSSSSDITTYAESISELNHFLEKRGIDFLYALAPNKGNIYDARYAPGYSSDAWKNIDQMLNLLSESDVNFIDLDYAFEKTGLSTEDLYFKTDHHWLPEAAFFATNEMLGYMEDEFGINYDGSMENYDAWTVETYEDFFLGSEGKRVGTYYVGVDDISIIYRTGQDIELSYISKGSTKWNYRNNVIDETKLTRCDYFNLNPYASYIGGDYPLVNIRNKNAANDLKIMVMGDSYRLPVETYLSAYFTEIYHIDLRHYTDGTLAQYIEEVQPDIVLMCTNSTTDGVFYKFGLEDYSAALEKTEDIPEKITLGKIVLDDGTLVTSRDKELTRIVKDVMIAVTDETSVTLENDKLNELVEGILVSMGDGDETVVKRADSTNQNNFTVICSNLKPGQTYTLTVDRTVYNGDVDDYIQMTLQNLSTNKAICNRYFEANSNDVQKWIFTVPEDAMNTYALYLYAGTKGQTAGASVEISDVILYEGIIEK